jgi:hypothetical protein
MSAFAPDHGVMMSPRVLEQAVKLTPRILILRLALHARGSLRTIGTSAVNGRKL